MNLKLPGKIISMKQTKIYCSKNFEKFQKLICKKRKNSANTVLEVNSENVDLIIGNNTDSGKIYNSKNFEKFKRLTNQNKKTNLNLDSSGTKLEVVDIECFDNITISNLEKSCNKYNKLLEDGELPNPEEMLVFLKLEENKNDSTNLI